MLITESFNGFKAPCIYKLIFPNGIYVGSAKNFSKRMEQHYYAMRSGRSSNKLNEAWKKYKGFDCEVIEYIDADKPFGFLREREEYWIKKLQPELNSEETPVGIRDTYIIREKRKMDKEEAQRRIEEYRRQDAKKAAEKAKKHKFFYKENLGTIRATLIDGKFWVVGGDFSNIFGYRSNPTAIIRKLVSSENICYANSDRGINAVHLNEDGVYELLSQCNRPTVSAVKDWYESEILPKLKEFEKDLNDRNSAA